ncbi:Pyroglutamyl peptidase domain-containing protein [Ceratobasidium theobromae]|uniref:Pyroglutamyl peptidase domain-containing protein n=1 Tax=Ceratobasidium theobromae TaxID=1582974 RepID=A0A5N5QVJ1_9AGAM|nr:Pyroglutamyl peptidase domain-containing protein [Ceratobasidium theobromae]
MLGLHTDSPIRQPFRNVRVNPSWLAVSPLNNETLKFTKPSGQSVEAHISALEIPVTYSAVLSTVPALHTSKQYDVVLHVGVGLEGSIAIERLAHKTGYNQPDADGHLCDPVSANPDKDEPGASGDDESRPRERVSRGFGRGFEHCGEILRTDINVDAIVAHLKSKKGLKVRTPCHDGVMG